MPYVIRKIRGKDLYSVKNPVSGKIHSFGTSLEKAKRQVRGLQFVDSYRIVKGLR